MENKKAKNYIIQQYSTRNLIHTQQEIEKQLHTYIEDLRWVVYGFRPLRQNEISSFLQAGKKHIESVAEKHGFIGYKQKELLNEFYPHIIRVVSRT